MRNKLSAVFALIFILAELRVHAADWPMLGRDGTRNAVSPEKGSPTEFQIGELNRITGKWEGAQNIRWAAPLGSMTFGDPVVANGQIWIGTNNFIPGADDSPDASVLMGFNVRDGKLIYKYISPRLPGGRVNDWPHSALSCSPLIERDRMWFTTNRAEVVCFDLSPLKRGESEPTTVWKVDMMKQFGVHPRSPSMGLGHTCSIAVHEDLIYVITGNGVGDNWDNLPAPEAPSLLCLNKNTGAIVWQDNSPRENVLAGQWASPLVIEVNGRAQVVVPQGDSWLRSFDALTGELKWKFDINPKTAKYQLSGRADRNLIMAPPVFYDGRVYIGSGGDAEHGEGLARLVCVDPTKTGDISAEFPVDADGRPLPPRRTIVVDSNKGERAVPNPNSGLVWEYTSVDRNGNGNLEFEEQFHRTHASVVIKDNLLVAADFSGLMHCLDAKTGKVHWTYDLLATVYAPPLIVDDKIYIGDEDGELAVFRLSANQPHAPIFEGRFESGIYTAPIFSDGVLYVASRNWLFAISKDVELSKHASKEGDWPQWRGAQRDNRSRDKGLLQEWPEAGPPLVWRVDGIGSGIASVSVAGGKVHTLGYHDGGEYVIALKEASAERDWQTRIGPEIPMSPLMRWLSQRSPTVDGDRVYAVTADGVCFCMTAATGKELWRVSYVQEFAAQKPRWGFCDFPLVDGDKLLCVPGGEKASVVALDKVSGKVIWQTLLPDAGPAAYGATVTAESNGVRQHIVLLDGGLFSVRASDGHLLWKYNGNSIRSMNSYTPLVRGNFVYQGNGFRNTGFAALKLDLDSKQEFSVKEMYLSRLGMDPFQDSTVLLEDMLFTFKSSGLPMCVDLNTGAPVWGPVRTDGQGKAAITYADKRLYVLHADGRMALVEPTRSGYVEKGSFRIPDHEPSIGATFPVVTAGRLYVRDNDRLFSYSIRSGETKSDPIKIRLEPPAKIDRAADTKDRLLRSVFVPTPHDVVEKMLALADVEKTDVVVDLGSGDGRIVIAAAKKYGCRAIGYELDRDLVASSQFQARKDGLTHLVTFERIDLFSADVADANVVALYLLPKQLEKLVPQLEKMKPGSRIVSHHFAIPGFQPDESITVESKDDSEKHEVHLWRTPLKRNTPETK